MTTARLYLTVAWDTPASTGDAESATLGTGLLVCDGYLLWDGPEAGLSSPEGVHWSWCGLLSWLVENWVYLLYDRYYPLELDPDPVTSHGFTIAIERHWDELWDMGATNDARHSIEDALVRQYESRHSISSALRGVYVFEVLIQRRQETMVISGDVLPTAEIPWREGLQCLEAVGETIAARLAGCGDAAARRLVAAWRARHPRPGLKVMACAAGTPSDYLIAVGGTRDEAALAAAFGQTGGHFEDNEFLTLARLGYRANLPPEALCQIFQHLRTLPAQQTANLDRFSSQATRLVVERLEKMPPHLQGQELAGWLYERIGRIEPEVILQSWGVIVTRLSLSNAPEIDAIGCWSASHGPAVLLNTASRRWLPGTSEAVALGHQLCHLLVDRHAALPFADVIDARNNQVTEQRARAFADEYLLPCRSFDRGAYPGDDSLVETVGRLAERFNVSHETAAWQIRRSAWARRLSERGLGILRNFVAPPKDQS